MLKPTPDNPPSYFQRYINQVPQEELFTAFTEQLPVIHSFLSTISEEKSNFAYAEGKWTIKDVLQHIIDTERIFNYRALCFARKESAILPGFEENDYAANADVSGRTWQDLIYEFIAVRKTTELMYKSFTNEALLNKGKASNYTISVVSIAFTTIGHFYHHKTVIEERYLSK